MANCAIVGINWGDEGKGRMVDYLSQRFDVVVRYQGGGNAGHTVINDMGKFALHLLPPAFPQRVMNILGNGVALDCENLLKEMETLRAAGVIITPENLKVSDARRCCCPGTASSTRSRKRALPTRSTDRPSKASRRSMATSTRKDRAGGRAPAPRALKGAPCRPS